MQKTSMRFLRIGVWVAALAVTLLLVCGITRNYARKRALQLRFADVELLATIYIDQTTSNRSPTMDDLTVEIKRRGLKLHNPSPLDAMLPCYKVVASGSNLADPDAVIIEETDNVKANNVVKAFADGHVTMENRRMAP
jgi:hypothetical protein